MENERTGIRLTAAILVAYASIIVFLGDIGWRRAGSVLTEYAFASFWGWLALGGVAVVAITAIELNQGEARAPHKFYGEIIRRRWQSDRLLSLVWPPFVCALLLGLFAIFKQRILINAEFTLDPIFYQWDRAIFGTDPWRLSPSSPGLTEFLGGLYYGWYAPMMLGTLACAFVTRRVQFRNRYLTAVVLTWVIVGSFMAYLLPAAGPCYWGEFVQGPNPYAELMAKLRDDVAASTTYNPVLDAQAYLLAAYRGNLVIGGGISAMPSMHVAAATLFACGAWSMNRLLGLIFAMFALLVWWASVHLGWHYFVDGLAAVPATMLVWLLCGRLFPERANK